MRKDPETGKARRSATAFPAMGKGCDLRFKFPWRLGCILCMYTSVITCAALASATVAFVNTQTQVIAHRTPCPRVDTLPCTQNGKRWCCSYNRTDGTILEVNDYQELTWNRYIDQGSFDDRVERGDSIAYALATITTVLTVQFLYGTLFVVRLLIKTKC